MNSNSSVLSFQKQSLTFPTTTTSYVGVGAVENLSGDLKQKDF